MRVLAMNLHNPSLNNRLRTVDDSKMENHTTGNRSSSPPVIAVCGFKNSGKTTLLEGVIPLLCNQGLAVAVIKHDAHGVQVDHQGKDSDRLFRAGADVLLHGPNETLVRRHPSSVADLEEAVEMLSRNHDVVLVEGHKQTPLPKIWVHGPDDSPPPPGVSDIGLELAWETERAPKATAWITERVHTAWRERRINRVVLVGGASRRMGRPKQLVVHRGVTLSERAVNAVNGPAGTTVLVGSGPLPIRLESLPRLPDSPGVAGPLAGLLSAMRWAPDTAWIVAACDMPKVNAEAVAWLIGQRRPGVWAVMPRLRDGRVEPLLAVYEPHARQLLEAQAARGRWGPRHLAMNDRVICPTPPAELHEAWENVNTPEEMASIAVAGESESHGQALKDLPAPLIDGRGCC
jgi:molybdopterin-guanine dinucleotide biosynthesis protein MobB